MMADVPNHDTEICIFVPLFLLFSSIGLVIRLYARKLKNLSLSYDDYLVIAAWVGSKLD